MTGLLSPAFPPALSSAAQLPAFPATPPAIRGPVLAVASGKGGVGKTWFAVTLAHALALQGRSVLLFDGDLGLANVDVQLGVQPIHDLGAVLAGRVALADAAFSYTPGGFRILAGRSGSGALSGLDRGGLDALLADLTALAGCYDDVVLDLGAGLDHTTRRLAAMADTLLVLATEEPTSLTDAYATLKLHAGDRRAYGSWDARIVVNQARSRAAGERTHAALSRACEHFLGVSPGLLGIVRHDEKVRDALRAQAPLLTRHPASLAAQDVIALAAVLTR